MAKLNLIWISNVDGGKNTLTFVSFVMYIKIQSLFDN